MNLTHIQCLVEEVGELGQALGNHDKVEILDALCDLQYLVDGTFIACGMAHLKDAAFAEVHRTNMAKLWEDGAPRIDTSGRIQKPIGWEGPELALAKILKL